MFLVEIAVKNFHDIFNDSRFSDLETDVFYTACVDYPEVLENLPEEIIEVDKLLSTQREVDHDKLKSDEPIVVVKRFGQCFIIDGHHRYQGAVKKKKKTMRAHVIEMPNEHVSLEWFSKKFGFKLIQLKNGIVRPM